MLKLAAANHGWNWIVTRPNFIVGVSKGNFMSLATTVALYASACKAFGEPLTFPGTETSYRLEYDFSTASNNARFQLAAATNPKAYHQAFNISDGTPLTWAALWPRIATWVQNWQSRHRVQWLTLGPNLCQLLWSRL
jgi:nucleoside-diphosphate-sugar epimerase